MAPITFYMNIWTCNISKERT